MKLLAFSILGIQQAHGKSSEITAFLSATLSSNHQSHGYSRHVFMALTEEFIQMKVNGDDTSYVEKIDTTIRGPFSSPDDEDVSTTNISEIATPRKLQPSDALGYFALSKVKSLARSAGTGIREPGNDGASSRAEFLDWQRQSLREVRKEVGTLDVGGEVRSTLIKALPTNKKLNGKEGKHNGDKGIKNSSNGSKATRQNSDTNDPTTISLALQTLEKDMSILDNLASLQSQLSPAEVGLLLGAVVASGIGPIVFPGTSVTEVLAPAAAAFSASITIGSEYIGRVAVADGKEIAANTIQCAAEAEALLANAERVKAITPLCVGLGATCASFALLTPTLVEVLNLNSVQMITQIYILCPLIAILAAAVANLALEETRDFASRAINVGVRRFAKGGVVGRTWLSTAEQVQKNSQTKTDRWWSFAGIYSFDADCNFRQRSKVLTSCMFSIGSVLPAPILGSLFGPPALSTKCIIVAALAAAQSAYFLVCATKLWFICYPTCVDPHQCL
jgi:hypothetical protein